MLETYDIPHEELDEIVGFNYTDYIKEPQEIYNFMATKETLFEINQFSNNIGTEDIELETLQPYKIDRLSNIVRIEKYYDYLLYEYLVLSDEEPGMHEDKLKFMLMHISQVKNLIDVVS